MQDGGLNKAWAEFDQRLTELGEVILAEFEKLFEAYGRWKTRRALRMPSDRIEWHPAPTGLRRRIRQAVCFLWRHDMVLVYDEIEDDFDIEHPGITHHCRRCGISFGYCLLHDGVDSISGEEWEPK